MTESVIVDAPAIFKARVWKYFGFEGGKSENGTVTSKRQNVICKISKISLKYSGNTTNLHSHVSRHHPEVKDQTTTQTVRASSDSVKAKEGIQSSLISSFSTKKLDSNKTTAITDAIAKFIIKDLRPYSVVENESFLNLIRTIEPKYKMPSRQHLSEKVVPALYDSVKSSLIQLMKDAEFIGLTTDGWTSRSNESYVTVTCHFVDKEWKMQSCVLQTRIMTESHTGENLAKLLHDVTQEWGIPEAKVAAVVTDNASNMVVAVREANMVHVKCIAHTLNLASQKALKVTSVSRVLAIIRRIVGYFHRSPKAFAVLKEKQTLLNLPDHKLKNDVVTRWNSSYDIVERYIEQQPAIQATLLTKDLRKSGDFPARLNDIDMAIAEDIVQILKPMKTATTVMCDENQPTLSVVFPLFNTLINSTKPDSYQDTDSRAAKDMKRAIHDDLITRYKKEVDVSLLHKAAAMDPRFKDLPLLTDLERMSVFSNIAIEASLMNDEVTVKQESADTHAGPALPNLPDLPVTPEPLDKEAKHETDSDSSPPKAKVIKLDSTSSSRSKCALDDLLGDVFISAHEEGHKSKLDIINDEIIMYRKSPSQPLSVNVMKWWRDNQILYPKLSKVARKYLCIPGTSVPSERIFSTSGDIVTAQRACLKACHVDKLVFLKKNLKL